MALPADPIGADGIEAFARRLRAGETTAAATTEAYLDRIAALDPRICAYEYVDAAGARTAAQAVDSLLTAGTDLGPLMGVPVAVKDLIAVQGMPVTAGSRVDVADLIGPEGDFVQRLRRAGCIILGKARTIEFAFGGAGGYNAVRGTPWNPWDAEIHRGPGGSSSGSAAAVSAGLAAFAIGTDTGGSVRLPAALCGLAGLKPSVGVWPLDGVFPLCSTFDTLGLLARSAADLALAFAALTGTQPVAARPVRGMRLGKPRSHFFEGLDAAVATSIDAAIGRLAAAGAVIEPVDTPSAGKPEAFFHVIVPTEFMASFGRERFARIRSALDPATAARGEMGLTVAADEYVRYLRLHRSLERDAAARMAGFDAWIAPTVSMTAPAIAEYEDVERGLAINIEIGRLTRPVNVFGMATTTTPVPGVGTSLPVGLQLMVAGGGDAGLIAAARALETVLGTPPMPDMTPFGG